MTLLALSVTALMVLSYWTMIDKHTLSNSYKTIPFVFNLLLFVMTIPVSL